ncbi:MAG: hypothetical protein ACJAUH_001886 [Saprospiraceae bacterium]|jgi:hypothetical protein
MIIENKKNMTLEEVEKILKNKMPDYNYKIVNNVVLVSKNENIQLNVIVEEETIQTIEAVGFITKIAVALGTVALAFYILQMFELANWVKWIIYVLSFLTGGVLSDVLHKSRYRKAYAAFKPKMEGILMKANE